MDVWKVLEVLECLGMIKTLFSCLNLVSRADRQWQVVTGGVKAHPFHAIPQCSTLLWNRAGVPSVPQCSTSPEHCGTPPSFTDVHACSASPWPLLLCACSSCDLGLQSEHNYSSLQGRFSWRMTSMCIDEKCSRTNITWPADTWWQWLLYLVPHRPHPLDILLPSGRPWSLLHFAC